MFAIENYDDLSIQEKGDASTVECDIVDQVVVGYECMQLLI